MSQIHFRPRLVGGKGWTIEVRVSDQWVRCPRFATIEDYTLAQAQTAAQACHRDLVRHGDLPGDLIPVSCPPDCDHSLEAEDDYGRCPTRAKAAFDRRCRRATTELRAEYNAYVAATQHIVEPLTWEAWFQIGIDSDGP